MRNKSDNTLNAEIEMSRPAFRLPSLALPE
jgi:hypothetical protein